MSLKNGHFEPSRTPVKHPVKAPVYRLGTLISADLTLDFAQTANCVDMDINFFGHYHWLTAPRPTLTRHPIPRTRKEKSLFLRLPE
ncbi:MAG: hypothetical protein A3J52_00930 [Omnitrophica bacterium RIFCSPHIGHO2_02_FULL_49_9]|nr:MAG: hypothetical protein A3J52_00930 [Omnitrophica bacterium RIFCSPHIGHO2_02_FULL_49_9]